MRVLVACEFSGIVRDAFRARGHNAVSCDLIPTERPGPHIMGDVRDYLADGWDLMVAHPPCTFLCNSGVRWLYEKPGRWDEMEAGATFFRELLNAPIERVCAENPVMHGYAQTLVGATFTQSIQPWQFGHGEIKRTCLWLRNLPPLTPTQTVAERRARVHFASPGPERWKERSRTLQGIADAMADQWGAL